MALTYIPSNAGVRAKTLFASTRATLTRELGSEKFVTTIFATEEEEVYGEQAWKERDIEGNGTSTSSFKREELMDEKERELELVRRAEEEARHGTAGRDVGTGGSLGRVSGIATGGGMGVNMPVDEDAKSALKNIQEGGLVQLVGFRLCSVLLSPLIYLVHRCQIRNRQTQRYRVKCLAERSGIAYIGLFAAIYLLSLSWIERCHLHLHVSIGIIHQGKDVVCKHASSGDSVG